MAVLANQIQTETLADLLRRLGGVAPDRILFRRDFGHAVENDVLELHDRENRLFELVEGVLVEKTMGYQESVLATCISQILREFVAKNQLGVVAGSDGMMRISTGLVRLPDVSVVLWHRLPGHKIPKEPIPSLVPDLAVEVLSPSNTKAEMDRKIKEYFDAGCQCVWIVDPEARTVRVHSSEANFVLLSGIDQLTAGPVLPGFHVSIAEVFERSGLD